MKRITEAQIRQVIREELIKFLEEATLRKPQEVGTISVNELLEAERRGKKNKNYADPTTGKRRPAELTFPVLLRSIVKRDEQMPIYKDNFGTFYIEVYTDEGGQTKFTLDQDVLPVIKEMGFLKRQA
jgi:hypothetical protein